MSKQFFQAKILDAKTTPRPELAEHERLNIRSARYFKLIDEVTFLQMMKAWREKWSTGHISESKKTDVDLTPRVLAEIIPIVKRCSCGVVHVAIPPDATYQADADNLTGWWWNCRCKSTLFWPDEDANQSQAA